MISDRERFTITIIALHEEPRHYWVEFKEPGMRAKQYACSPNNSVGNLIARLCNAAEIDGEQ